MRKLETIIVAIMCAIDILVISFMGFIIIDNDNKIQHLKTENAELQEYTNVRDYQLQQKNAVIDNLTTEVQEMEEMVNQYVDEYFQKATLSLEMIIPLKEVNKLEWFKLYKEITSSVDPPETIYDYYTEEQITIMWKAIETETYQCSFDAKVNVANVILNRVSHDMFPPDPMEVVTNINQFAYGRSIIEEDTKLALEYAFMIEDTTDGCIGFRSDINPTTWNGWTYQFTDGYHYFYNIVE